MLKLGALLAYGLKNRLGDDFVNIDIHVLVGSELPALPRKSTATFSRSCTYTENFSISRYIFK